MSESVQELRAIHLSIINLLIGTLAGSIVSSAYYVGNHFCRISNFDLFKAESIIIYELIIIYFSLLLVSYRDLFMMYSPDNFYTREVIRVINKRSPSLKHTNYMLMFSYLVIFACLPAFIVEKKVWFFYGLSLMCLLDLVWSLLLRKRLQEIMTITSSHGLQRFAVYNLKWINCDLSIFFLSLFIGSTFELIKRYLGDVICILIIGAGVTITLVACYLFLYRSTYALVCQNENRDDLCRQHS